jgi:hypothetical protein
MLINRKDWEVLVRFSAVEMPTLLDEIAYIPASSFRGALRQVIETRKLQPEILLELFGDRHNSGLMLLTDLRLVSNVGRPQLRTHLQVAIDRLTGAVASGRLYEREVMHDATFSGKLLLRNGGVFPAVRAHHAISQSLPHLRLGRGTHQGFGLVQACQFTRSESDAASHLNPVEKIFRNATHAIIEQIAEYPDLAYSLEWRDLERLMAQVFEEIGFSVLLTQASQDGGKDIVLYCLSGSQHRRRQPLKYYVELKHWRRGTRVGTEPVNKLVQVSIRDGASGSVFLSTSGFTANVGKSTTPVRAPSLGDLSTIQTLCRFYVASRNNDLFSTSTLEEIVSLTRAPNGEAQQGASADHKTAARLRVS